MRFFEQEYAARKKPTRRDRSPAEIDAITSGAARMPAIEPFCARGEGRSRPPTGVARRRRRYVAQHGFGVSDAGIEDAG